MVKAVNFIVRDVAGGLGRGSIAGDGVGNVLPMGSGEDVSLNLTRSQVAAYSREGGDLIVTLTDERQLRLQGFFDANPGQPNQLFLSANGQIAEVYLTDAGGGTLYAAYAATETWDKYSALDALRFDDSDAVAVVAGSGDDATGMAGFIPGLLGGSGLLWGGAAVVGGATLIGGGGGGRANPTVDNATGSYTLTTNTVNPTMTVSGTGEPGDAVKVTVGGKEQTTTIGTDGKWAVTFPTTGLPADGTHEAVVVVTQPGGPSVTLDGPTFVIDLTPPAVAVTAGTEKAGDVENAAEYADGVTLSGTGEPGASISVVIGSATRTTTVSSTGTWSVTFPTTQVQGGEYTTTVTVTATDALGNRTVITERVVIDTVPNPLAVNPVTADNTVNAAEAQAGFAVTGTTVPGASVTVTIGTVTQTVTATATGTWSATFAAGTVSPGEYDATVTARTTDAAGNVSTTTHTMRVDTATAVTLTGPVAGDDIVSATEAAGGVTLTGTAQAGASLVIGWGTSTLTTTAGADGRWSVTVPSGSISPGEYGTTVTVTATDAVGNSATTNRAVRVDTIATVSIDAVQAGDNTVSGAERAGGVTLTGRAEAGATVVVSIDGASRTVTATQSGAWSATFAASDLPQGTGQATITARATDAAGNSASATQALAYDTEVRPLTAATSTPGADRVLNAAEAAGGLVVTGTVEPGSTVSVRLNSGAARSASVAADGSWTVTLPPGDIPAGESNGTLTISATDRFGNTGSLTETLAIDTVVRSFALTGGPIGGDGVLNAAEVAAGLPLRGTAEPGASVVVTLSSGATRTATADSAGNWSLTFGAADLPTGERAVTATVTATDRAGNTATLTENFRVDTVAPGSPEVVSFSRDANGLRAIGTEATDDLYSFTRIDAGGGRTSISATRTEDTVFDETNFRFSSTVPDGSYLVIDTADAAGNRSSTLLVVDNTNASVVDLSRPNLSSFDLSAIDLTFAPDARMAITVQQLTAVTGADQTLLVKGGADDTVTMTGASATGQTRVIEGERYDVYALGTGTVLLDEDIRPVI